MATHSSLLAWKIPWTEQPGKLQSLGLQRDRHDRARTHAGPSNNTYEYITRTIDSGILKWHMRTNVHSSIIHNSQHTHDVAMRRWASSLSPETMCGLSHFMQEWAQYNFPQPNIRLVFCRILCLQYIRELQKIPWGHPSFSMKMEKSSHTSPHGTYVSKAKWILTNLNRQS